MDTVAALRMIGIHTIASCGGHVDRLLGPYVMLASPEATTARRRASESDDQAVKRRLLKKAAKLNAHELATLLPYVERFYRGQDASRSRRLIVQGFGPMSYRLTTQAADLIAITPRSERHALLDEQRQELRDFTEFLKAEFFGASS
ncbi:hypothetical protein F3K32_36000 [Streptomyces sp. LBUM 1483]|nr:hypothetical protein [Streptomyces sp. LBUM 1481]MBP5925502.1 hypothetical protein [Streptomyces sp. LBUM 1483]